MIKRTLLFTQPAYLKVKHDQLVVEMRERTAQIPLEDIGVVILENQQITITQAVLQRLLDFNAAIISCDKKHLPRGMFLNLDGHSEHAAKSKAQLDTSLPLKKQLWKQTVEAKIRNQAALLAFSNQADKYLFELSKNVLSGDSDNLEAQAARYYWKHIFSEYVDGFQRDREGDAPNNLLNYGYTILRGISARAIVGTGLLPVRGIFHQNKYNAYALADDVMEPYRPLVDKLVLEMLINREDFQIEEIGVEEKKYLLKMVTEDVIINNEKSPFMVAMSRTCSSLSTCFLGEKKNILYPDMYMTMQKLWT